MSDLTKQVLLRVTPMEHAKLHHDAADAGLSVNNYIRARLLNGKPAHSNSPSPYGALNEEVQRQRGEIAGLQDAITQVRAMLEGKE